MGSQQRSKRGSTVYRVSFTREQELYQICARRVQPSELWGLIEISDFVFPESKLVYNPGEERLRREFEGIQRTFLPYHSIVRIDELRDTQAREIKIVPLQAVPAGQPNRPAEPPMTKSPER